MYSTFMQLFITSTQHGLFYNLNEVIDATNVQLFQFICGYNERWGQLEVFLLIPMREFG